MYARVTQLEIDTARIAVEEVVELFQEAVLPELRKQPDYRGVYAMSTSEGQAVLVSFWASEEAAAGMNDGGWYATVIAEHATFFRSPPGRSYYEVLVADVPELVT